MCVANIIGSSDAEALLRAKRRIAKMFGNKIGRYMSFLDVAESWLGDRAEKDMPRPLFKRTSRTVRGIVTQASYITNPNWYPVDVPQGVIDAFAMACELMFEVGDEYAREAARLKDPKLDRDNAGHAYKRARVAQAHNILLAYSGRDGLPFVQLF